MGKFMLPRRSSAARLTKSSQKRIAPVGGQPGVRHFALGRGVEH